MNINTIIIKEKLLELKKYNGTIVFSFGEYYIQFLKESNKRTIYCEVVSNNFLKSISKKQIQLIKNLNFKIDTENFYKNYKTNEIEIILNEVENIFSKIFQVNFNTSVVIDNMIEYPELQTKNLNPNKSPLSKNPNPITIQERIISNYFIIGFSIIVVCIVIWMTSNNASNNNVDTILQQEITNSNLEDSDNNNPNTSKSLQSNISADDEIKLREFKDKVQILFDQLMIFKNEKYFQEVGFAECCKYNKWLKNVEALIGTYEAELFINQEHYYHINDLVQLGRDYIHLEGRESEYTKWNKKILIEALKEK